MTYYFTFCFFFLVRFEISFLSYLFFDLLFVFLMKSRTSSVSFIGSITLPISVFTLNREHIIFNKKYLCTHMHVWLYEWRHHMIHTSSFNLHTSNNLILNYSLGTHFTHKNIIYIHIYIHTHTYIQTYMYVHTFTQYIHVYTYIHIHIHPLVNGICQLYSLIPWFYHIIVSHFCIPMLTNGCGHNLLKMNFISKRKRKITNLKDI